MDSNQMFEEMWEDALDQYFDSTDRTHREQKLLKQLKTSDDLQKQLDADQQKFSKFRAKHGNLTSKLKLAIRPFMTLSDVASATLSASPFAPASAVLGAVVFIVKAADGVSEAFDWIEELFDKLGDFTIRLEKYIEDGISQHLKKKVVQILVCLLNILAQAEKTIKDKRWKKYTAVLFLGQDDQVKSSFDKLASLFEDEQRLVTAIAFATNQRMDKRIEEIMQTNNKVLEVATKVEERADAIQQSQHRVAILKWLSSTNFAAEHSDNIERRQEGSGEWFLHDPKFSNWKKGSDKTLFCPGMPGAGKTTMAATIIDHLYSAIQGDRIAITYIYCDYKKRAYQNAKFLLGAVLRQLVQSCETVPTKISELYADERKKSSGLSLSEITDAIRSILASYENTYLVIDALDECIDEDETHTKLLAEVRKLQAGSDLRVVSTSRFVPDIEDEFVDVPMLEVRASDHDIRNFIKSRMIQRPRCIRKDQDMQTSVQNAVVEAAGGMFLLARLHVQWLQDMTTKKQVTLALKSLLQSSKTASDPFEVYQKAYDKTIERIDGQPQVQKSLALDALSWITYARRPLTTAELCCALAIEEEEDYLDQDNIPSIEDVVTVCAGLVTVDEESNVVRLIHYTAQEYLERIRKQWIPDAESNIASSLIRYLSFSCFLSGMCVQEVYQLKISEHVLAEYAAQNWGHHAASVEEAVLSLGLEFLRNESLVQSAMQIFFDTVEQEWQNAVSDEVDDFTALHVAALFNLPLLAEGILTWPGSSSGAVLDAQDHDGNTPLIVAAAHGNISVVKVLLSHGASVEIEASRLESPLAAAAENSQTSIVKLLLEHQTNLGLGDPRQLWKSLERAARLGSKDTIELLLGIGDNEGSEWSGVANQKGAEAIVLASAFGHKEILEILLSKCVDVRTHRAGYERALWKASSEGNLEIVQLWIEQGALIVPIEEEGYTDALYVAVERGCDRIVEYLISVGADIHKKHPDIGSVLHAAAARGHIHIFKLLLDAGADPKYEGGKDLHLLQAACFGGKKEMVELLLDLGADVNAQGGRRGNALQTACGKGTKELVELLLDFGADVNAQGGFYGNALQAACYNRKKDIVELLVSSGADVNAQGGYYGNALQAACLRDEEIAVLLLDAGANVNAQGGRYGQALQASMARWEESLSTDRLPMVLIDMGANIHAEGGYYSGALQAAAHRGKLQEVQLLLEKSAEFNQIGGSNDKRRITQFSATEIGSALCWALKGRHEEIARMLLDSGADVNTQGMEGSALQVALQERQENTADLLLDRGAEVNTHDEKQASALYWASKKGYVKIVKRLLGKGADVNFRGADSSSALQVALQERHEIVADLLLDGGAEVNTQDTEHASALYWASRRGLEKIVKRLLEQGAEINVVSTEYAAPLVAAAGGGTSGHLKTVEILLENGADLHARGGTRGYNALEEALHWHRKDIVRLLTDKMRGLES